MRSFIIAIDGRAASGKTTLAAKLGSVIHMDDFFLPAELRTPDNRVNFHHTRFAQEVLPFLRSEKAFTYRIYDCAKGDFNGVREVFPAKILVVEGAYSCHPILGEYMDLRVFCDVEPEIQARRILARNGKDGLTTFAEKWIPLEEKYFKTHDIKQKSDVVFSQNF